MRSREDFPFSNEDPKEDFPISDLDPNVGRYAIGRSGYIRYTKSWLGESERGGIPLGLPLAERYAAYTLPGIDFAAGQDLPWIKVVIVSPDPYRGLKSEPLRDRTQ